MSALPDFIPEIFRDQLAGRSFEFKIPAQIKGALRRPEWMKISEHSAKYRRVTDGMHVGEWRKYYVPHAPKILDVFGEKHVREVWFCGPEQGANKTGSMLSIIAWGIDIYRGDIFYLGPDEKSVKKVFGEKVIPMIKQSPRLAALATGKEDDLSASLVKLKNGVKILPAWANSPSTMATFWAKIVLIDEADKGTELSGREADRITLGKKRLRLSGNAGKLFVGSTPAGLFIYKGVYSCPQIWEYRCRCPECGRYEKFDVSRIEDIESLTVEEIEGGQVQLRYICSRCGCTWDAQQRESAIRSGRWHCEKGHELSRPSRVGFHMTAFECVDVPLAEIAVAYLKAKQGNVVAKIAWANGYLCIDYKYEESDHEEDYILRLVDQNQQKGVCPDNPSAVIVIADTQQVGFWFQVFALGYGVNFEINVIDYGYVKDFEGLVEVQNKEYLTPSGNKYRPESGWIDSGGGLDKDKKKHTRTVQVYTFCREKKFWRNRRPFWHPLKGEQNPELPWLQKRIDYWPSSIGKKIPIPGGLILNKVNSTLWKDDLDRRLQIDLGEEGCIRLPACCDAAYAAQLCAWYRQDNGLWKAISGRDDHLGDTFVYLLCIADMIGVKNRKKREPGDVVKKKPAVTVYSGGVQ